MDGIDAALIETDGETIAAFGPARTSPYDETFRAELRGVLGRPADPADPRDAALARELTIRHAALIDRLLADAGLSPGDVTVIGFHGHTVCHRPTQRITCQIGDGALLAAETRIPVVGDFRANDVAQGGEGAPFAPLYHAARARELEKPLAVLNLGGVANVTWIGPDEHLLAFDTGPGNSLIDDWARQTIGRAMDEGGRLARAGRADGRVLARLADDAFFARRPPKSLDRNHFSLSVVDGLAPSDGAATLARFTAEAVARSRDFFPAPVRRWLVCGGGRKNTALMAALAEILDAPVASVETVGWRGDHLEAEAFAFLAVRSLRGLALSLPETTGVKSPATGGRIYLAPGRAACSA